MTRGELEGYIRDAFMAVFKGQNKNVETLSLTDETLLLQSGLDSLGFAILVTQLEEDLGYDPFTESEDIFYPQTYKEFVDFYQKFLPT